MLPSTDLDEPFGMGVTVLHPSQSRVTASRFVNVLAVEECEPGLDAPCGHTYEHIVCVAGSVDATLCAGIVEGGAATGQALVVAVDHHDQPHAFPALRTNSLKFRWELLANELFSRTAPVW